jgi:hypothetical protein
VGFSVFFSEEKRFDAEGTEVGAQSARRVWAVGHAFCHVLTASLNPSAASRKRRDSPSPG